MTKKSAMTEAELATLIDNELRQSYGYGDGKLEQERRRALYYFMAEAKEDLAPPSIEGRSKVVDTTVRNTVLGMEGPLLKTFYGSDNVFEFEESTPEDAPKAKLISEYVNHIFRKKNPGYLITATWIREALLQKKGIIKVWWDESDIETTEDYNGQTIEQITILLGDGDIEIVNQRGYPDEDAEKEKTKVLEQAQQQLHQMYTQALESHDPAALQQYQQASAQFEQMQAQEVPMLYDVTIKRKTTGGRICIENVPPEEFIMSKRGKNLADTPFCSHRFKRTVAQLEARGYTVPDTAGSDDSSADQSQERIERLSYLDNDDTGMNTPFGEADPSQREIAITESYLQVDFDGTGVPEWRQVVKSGTHVFANEPCDGPPFVDLGSIPLPHLFYGTCPADLALEPQRINTSLIRSALDNQYLAANGRYYAVKGRVNLDDLLNSRPGGVVRVDDPTAVGRLDQGSGDVAGTMALVEWSQKYAEESTGHSRQGSFTGNELQQTATQANIVSNMADRRLEAISRYMAETGFQQLGEMILKLVCKYQRKAEMVKIGGEWHNIDPREWTNKFSLTINVGLGTGNKDQLVSHLNLLGMKTVEGLQLGFATPKNLYNVSARLSNALGFKDGDEFFTDPEKMPPKPPVQDPAVVKAQLDAQNRQAELQFEREKAQMLAQVELQVAQTKAQAQMEVDRNRQQLEAEQQSMKIQLQAEQAERDAQRSFQEMQMKLELEREKLALKKYEIDIRADAAIVTAQVAVEQKSASQAAAEEQSSQDMANNGSSE